MADVGGVPAGVVERACAVGGAGLGEGLGDGELGGDGGVGEGARVLLDGGGGALDEALVDLGEGLGGIDRMQMDGALGGALGKDAEGRVGRGGGPRGEAGGGEDRLKLAGADDRVDLGDAGADLVTIALDEAAGDDEALRAAAVGDLVLHHLEDGVHGLLLGGIDEGAGVDDDDVGVGGGLGQRGAVVVDQAHHDLGVDEVLGAAEGDEADLGGGGRRRGGGGVLIDGGGRGHSLLV